MTNEELIEEVKQYYSDNFACLSSDQPTLSILTNVARHFAQWGAEHAKKDEIPVSDDLEEAAGKRLRRVCNLVEETKEDKPLEERLQELKEIRAEKDLDEAADNHIREVVDTAGHPGWDWTTQDIADAFIAGYNLCREQMLKAAVKWLVDEDYDELTDKGRFILGSVGIGYNGYYIPYSDLLKLPKEDKK